MRYFNYVAEAFQTSYFKFKRNYQQVTVPRETEIGLWEKLTLL